MQINTIAVEGISGIGKSNLGHYLSLNYNKIETPNRWFFELDNDNPLIPQNHDSRIINESTDLLYKYLNNEIYSNQVNIFDGRLFMVNINKSLNDGLSKNQIIYKMKPIIDLINAYNIYIIMFYTDDIEKSFKNTMEQRDCLEWYINDLKSSKYGENLSNVNIKTILEHTIVQQDIMMTLFDQITTNKKLLDITDLDWDSKYNEVDRLFNFKKDAVKNTELSEYSGVYNNYSANEQYIIEFDNETLKCTTHPYQKYKPVEQIFKLHPIEKDIFTAKGHPVKIKFTRNSDKQIDGLFENGIHREENVMGYIKDKFLRVV